MAKTITLTVRSGVLGDSYDVKMKRETSNKLDTQFRQALQDLLYHDIWYDVADKVSDGNGEAIDAFDKLRKVRDLFKQGK